LQNLGIGRGMKVGKESIFGTMAALNAWKTRDHKGIRTRETAALALWHKAAQGFDGIKTALNPDVTGNPLERLKLSVDPNKAGASARAIGHALAQNTPPIIVRDHEVELGYIQLDPCNLIDGQAKTVAKALHKTLQNAASGKLTEPDATKARNASIQAYLDWNMA